MDVFLTLGLIMLLFYDLLCFLLVFTYAAATKMHCITRLVECNSTLIANLKGRDPCQSNFTCVQAEGACQVTRDTAPEDSCEDTVGVCERVRDLPLWKLLCSPAPFDISQEEANINTGSSWDDLPDDPWFLIILAITVLIFTACLTRCLCRKCKKSLFGKKTEKKKGPDSFLKILKTQIEGATPMYRLEKNMHSILLILDRDPTLADFIIHDKMEIMQKINHHINNRKEALSIYKPKGCSYSTVSDREPMAVKRMSLSPPAPPGRRPPGKNIQPSPTTGSTPPLVLQSPAGTHREDTEDEIYAAPSVILNPAALNATYVNTSRRPGEMFELRPVGNSSTTYETLADVH